MLEPIDRESNISSIYQQSQTNNKNQIEQIREPENSSYRTAFWLEAHQLKEECHNEHTIRRTLSPRGRMGT